MADFVLLAPGTAIYRVPDAISDAVAASANCAMATASGLIRSSGGVAGRSVLVLGAGVLGLSVVAMAQASGASRVFAADPSPERRDRALRFGATEAVDVGLAMVAQMRSATEGRGVDVTFEASGAAEAVRDAIAAVRVGGTVVLAGTVLPVGTIAFDPEDAVRRMLTIRGVHNYHPRDLGDALDFLGGRGAAFPWSELVVAEYPLEQAERGFEAAHARPGERVAVRAVSF